MSASTDSARDAICERAAQLAAENPSTDDLVKLADAVSRVTYGPQGGAMANSTDYRYTADTTSRHADDKGAGKAGFA